MEDRMVEYSHYSGKFNFEIIDPIKEPERVREFFGPEKQYLDLPTLVFKTDLKDEEINSTDEEDITNALIKVTRDELRKVYFLQGHGEKAIFPDEPGMASAQLVKDELEKQLPAQVDRLVADVRFHRAMREFTTQWLQLDKFDVVEIDGGKGLFDM